MSIKPLNLEGTPIWEYVKNYCRLRKQSPAVGYAYLKGAQVPDQLKQQVHDTGEALINANITP